MQFSIKFLQIFLKSSNSAGNFFLNIRIKIRMLDNILTCFANFFQNIKNIGIVRIFFHGNIAASDTASGYSGNSSVIVIFKQNIIIDIPGIT